MLHLWKRALTTPTSAVHLRQVHVTSGCSLASKTSVKKSVAPPVDNLGTTAVAPQENKEVDLRDTRNAYLSKSSSELFRAYFVFRMCSYETLLKHQKKLLGFARKVMGRNLFRRAMRMSVYGQFMAGEKEDEILKAAHRHHDYGVRPMFAYTASEKHGDAEGMLGSSHSDDAFSVNYEAMQHCIEMAKLSPKLPKEFVKVTGKLTALANADIFRVMTSLIDANTALVNHVTSPEEQTPCKDIKVRLEKLVTSQDGGSLSAIADETGLPIPSNFKSLDWRSLTTCLAFHVAVSRNTEIADLLKEVQEKGIQHCPLSAEQETELLCVWSRMDDLAKRSSEAGACLVVDAEQTYLQSAMDLMTLDLMRRYNTQRPVVHNTYQCYLRRTYDVITRDLASADAEGFYLGAKVVRGGYMDEERNLAAKHGYPDPVNPTFEATTDMYFRVAEELLQRHLGGTIIQTTFATHNEDTVKHILKLMKKYGVTLDPNVFSFAQLIGMRDHIAFILGQKKLPANKLLHYGDVEDCVAYLSRRLTENRSGVPTANVERSMLSAEITRRMRQGEFFRRKSVQ